MLEKQYYTCSICNKKYKSYQSIWNHNNRYHNAMNIMIKPIDNKERKFECTNCNKKFTTKHCMQTHMNNICKIKDNNVNDIAELKKQVAELQKSVLENKNTKNISTNEKPSSSCNYIYLIEKFDVNNNHFIYKFGKTNRPIMERIKEHCLSSKILLILNVDDCNVIENNILKVLNSDSNIKREKDIGNEYFYCNDSKYIIDIILKNLSKNDDIVV